MPHFRTKISCKYNFKGGFKPSNDQIGQVAKLLGLRVREAKELLTIKSYDELKIDALLYHKIRMRIGLNHPEMRTFLSERRAYRLKEIAEGLNIPT